MSSYNYTPLVQHTTGDDVHVKSDSQVDSANADLNGKQIPYRKSSRLLSFLLIINYFFGHWAGCKLVKTWKLRQNDSIPAHHNCGVILAFLLSAFITFSLLTAEFVLLVLGRYRIGTPKRRQGLRSRIQVRFTLHLLIFQLFVLAFTFKRPEPIETMYLKSPILVGGLLGISAYYWWSLWADVILTVRNRPSWDNAFRNIKFVCLLVLVVVTTVGYINRPKKTDFDNDTDFELIQASIALVISFVGSLVDSAIAVEALDFGLSEIARLGMEKRLRNRLFDVDETDFVEGVVVVDDERRDEKTKFEE